MLNKYILFLILFILSSLFIIPPSQAHAATGPLGLNELRAEAGPGVGQITLTWARYYSNVDNYSIAYGTSSGNYQYGAANIGNTVVYTVGHLNPGQRYYFFIYPSYQGKQLAPVSPEISEVAAGTSHTVIGTAGPTGPRGLTAVTGPTSGQVTLTWHQNNPATTSYSVVYGTQPGRYQYGALNIANATGVGAQQTYTVGYLNPGQRYYFAVIPMQGATGIYSSAEVSQVAHQ